MKLFLIHGVYWYIIWGVLRQLLVCLENDILKPMRNKSKKIKPIQPDFEGGEK